MRKGKNFLKHLTALLLIGLTLCSTSSCRSTQFTNADVKAVLAFIAPPMPAPPEMEPVSLEIRDGGFVAFDNDYRALECNIIALREYAAKLEIIIRFYREDK